MEKIKFYFLTLLFVSAAYAQNDCPVEIFLGKWANPDFGFELQCGKMILLNKNENWAYSKNENASYFFIKPYKINDNKILISWVKNFSAIDAWSKGKWEKVPSTQFRIFKFELLEDGSLSFSMTEKKVSVEDLPQADWSTMKVGDEGIFEKTFILKKFNN
ncbi:hypothetical protein [Flavobacterium sp.]|uniref:hypothetical protein n=1 Tax=Flavobacterium sp. TaxID=239 RepID=UPI0039E33C48